jgi:hypothetical protein
MGSRKRGFTKPLQDSPDTIQRHRPAEGHNAAKPSGESGKGFRTGSSFPRLPKAPSCPRKAEAHQQEHQGRRTDQHVVREHRTIWRRNRTDPRDQRVRAADQGCPSDADRQPDPEKPSTHYQPTQLTFSIITIMPLIAVLASRINDLDVWRLCNNRRSSYSSQHLVGLAPVSL